MQEGIQRSEEARAGSEQSLKTALDELEKLRCSTYLLHVPGVLKAYSGAVLVTCSRGSRSLQRCSTCNIHVPGVLSKLTESCSYMYFYLDVAKHCIC